MLAGRITIMDKHRIIAHVFMWGLVALGIFFAFALFPDTYIFSSLHRFYLTFIVIPLFVVLVYYLASAVYFRFKHPISASGLERLIRSGVYGRVAHPTCMALAIIGWIIFLYHSTWQVFMSNLWTTMIVFFWIKLEEHAFSDKPRRPPESDGIG